jgi:hypothetical protein
MPPRADCPGGDHRPPATGGSCACGMVTRVLSRKPQSVVAVPLLRPDLRDVFARCLYDGPGDPLAPDATDHRPDEMRMSTILRRRAERMLAALAAAVVPADGDLVRAA